MKSLKKCISTILILLISIPTALAQVSISEVYVATDKSLTTDFSELESFKWASYAANDDFTYTLNDAVLKAKLREEIADELDAKGYDYDVADSDFLVNFRVFEGKGKFKGYVDVYKDENYWSPAELRKDLLGIPLGAEMRTRDDMRYYKFKPGTLMIQFVDTKTNALVWSGYATGIEDQLAIDGDDDHLAEVVEKIFDEYNFGVDS